MGLALWVIAGNGKANACFYKSSRMGTFGNESSKGSFAG